MEFTGREQFLLLLDAVESASVRPGGSSAGTTGLVAYTLVPRNSRVGFCGVGD